MCWDYLIEAEHPKEQMQIRPKPALPEPSLDQLLDNLLKPSNVQPQASGE